MELREFIAITRARLGLVIACALIAAAAALAVSFLLPPSYVASTQILIGPGLSTSDRDPAQLQAASSMAQTFAIALKTRATAQAVIDELQLNMTTDQLRSSYSVSLSANAPVITVSASARTAEQAAAIASAVVQQLITQTAPASQQDASLTAAMNAQIASVEALNATTKARIAQLSASSSRTDAQQAQLDQQVQQAIQLQTTLAQLLSASASASYNTVAVIDPAVPPTDPASPRPLLYAGLALVLGGLVGLALAFALPSRDREANRSRLPTG